MARVKYFNPNTGKWEYADSCFAVGGNDSGGNVELDTTLTQSGKAADAKAVGDKIAEITGISLIEPADDDIPKVYFTGTLPTSKTEEGERLTMHYISKTADFIYPVTLNVQGGSSTGYPKKNFTLKPYKDSTYEKKQKLTFKGWPEMNKFVLKAHWIDHSHVRNVGSAKLWGKIVQSRSDYDSLPEELRNAPNNGATDGFTVKVFANGVYQGLYEWIVPKDKLFGQDKDIATHSILNSEWNNQPTCAFATTTPTINGNWSEELQDTMTADTKTSMENWIKFVAGSTDEEFVANAENYFDVLSVIDADIFDRVFCTVDNLCRNQIVFKYDSKWFVGKWDLDAVLGLPPLPGGSFFAYNTEYQTGYEAYKNFGITNLLYQRTENLFLDRFKARYAELRSGVLSIENILDVYERLTDVITTYDGLLAEDCARTTGGGKFTGVPYVNENNIQQLRNFVAQRIPYMDEVIENMTGESGGGDVAPDVPETVPCTGIALDKTELTFNGEGTQTITATVTPSDTTDTLVWVSSNPVVASITVDGNVCTVQSVSNGDATITVTCGGHSASCAVTVSGIVIENVMSDTAWEYGSFNTATGSEITASDEIITDAIDISKYVGKCLLAEFNGADDTTQKILFYNSNGQYIWKSAKASDAKLYALPLTNAAKMKVVMGAAYTGVSIYVTARYSADADFSAAVENNYYYNPNNGGHATENGVLSRLISIEGAKALAMSGVVSGAFFDIDMKFVGGISYNANTTTTREIYCPENTAYVGINYSTADSVSLTVHTSEKERLIGWSEVLEIN